MATKKTWWKCGFVAFDFITIFFLLVDFGYASTIYVHPTEGAYHTIQDGINAAATGDTVLVAPGNYTSFAVNKKLAITSEAGPGFTIISSGASLTFEATAARSLLSGFTITLPGGTGIYVNSNCDYLRIQNNIISGCGVHGIDMYAAYGQDLDFVTILNNTISFNNGSGIYFQRSDGYSDDDGNLTNSAIVNNILFHNTAYGIYSNADTDDVNYCVFANNNFWDNATGSMSGITANAATGNLFVDPLFIDPDTGNFHLQGSSQLIDSGKASSLYNDPDGTRNDMGVYGGPGAASFWPSPAGGPVVTNLSVTPPSVPVGGNISLKATGKIR